MTHDNRQYGNFISSADDILTPPPPPIEANIKPAQPSDAGLGFVVVTANVLVTTIIIVGMLIDGQHASRAFMTGAAYFALTTVAYVFVHTGALSAIVAVCQQQKTERLRIEAYADIAELAIKWRLRIEDNRAIELQAAALPADLSRRLSLLEDASRPPAQGLRPGSFVAAYAEEDATVQEAKRWVEDLYLPNGMPDKRKVQLVGEDASLGRLRIRVIGSKRGDGSREAGLWLLHKGVIARVPGGYQLRLDRYPTRESLRTLR